MNVLWRVWRCWRSPPFLWKKLICPPVANLRRRSWWRPCRLGWVLPVRLAHSNLVYSRVPICARMAAIETILRVVLLPPILGPVRNKMLFPCMLMSLGTKLSFRHGCRSCFISRLTSPLVTKLGRHIECMFMKLTMLRLHRQSSSHNTPNTSIKFT